MTHNENDYILGQWFFEVPPSSNRLLGGYFLIVVTQTAPQKPDEWTVVSGLHTLIGSKGKNESVVSIIRANEDEALAKIHEIAESARQYFKGGKVDFWEVRRTSAQLVDAIENGALQLPYYLHVYARGTPEEVEAAIRGLTQ